jgi:hypothetical protein
MHVKTDLARDFWQKYIMHLIKAHCQCVIQHFCLNKKVQGKGPYSMCPYCDFIQLSIGKSFEASVYQPGCFNFLYVTDVQVISFILILNNERKNNRFFCCRIIWSTAGPLLTPSKVLANMFVKYRE